MRSAVVTIALAGCTSWSTTTVYGPKREAGRQLLGAPSMATLDTAAPGAAVISTYDGGYAFVSRDADSMNVTHCVQQAQVLYEQPVTTVPYVSGRPLDVGGAILLGIAGSITIGISEVSSHSLFEDRDPTAGFVAGGAMVAAGAGLLVYSLVRLPKGPKPELMRNRREWIETVMVESTGCAAPTNVAQQQPAPANDAALRLQKLDQLRASGSITDKEYQRKRKEIIDGI